MKPVRSTRTIRWLLSCASLAFVILGPGAPTAKSIGILSVSPTSGLVSSGFVGGPFSPPSQVYVLTNRGNTTLSWAATKSQTWVTLSATNGTLASHATTSVTVSINSNANALAVGNYSPTVTFTNRTNNNGTTSRLVTLTVNAIPAPSGLTATTISTNQINLSWTDNSSNETTFRIERAPDNAGSPGTYTEIATVTSNVTTYGDTSLSPNATYWYRVRAHNAASDSPYSNQSSTTTLPLPPSNLTAAAVSTNQIHLAWTGDSAGEAGFLIERAPDSAGSPGPWTQIATAGTNVTTYNDSGLSPNTTYWYRVRAYNAGGNSGYSNQANAITLSPLGLTATAASATQVNLSWSDASTNEDGFKIERSIDGTNFTQIAQVLPNTTTYRDTGAWPGTTYFYGVQAYNTSGDSGISGIASAGTPALCDASVVACGWNGYGQTAVPTNLSGVVAVSAGMEDSFALRSDGTVLGWGDNSYGILTPPAGLTGVVAVSANVASTLALKSDGTMVMWGFEWDQLPNVTGVVAIANGWQHSLALLSDGIVIGWGLNESGQITIPTNLAGVVAIAAGGYHSLALRSDGTVVGWGDGASGLATPPTNLTGVVAIAAGGHHSLALLSDGTVVSWGDNTYGQATPPAGLTGVRAISAGWQHSLALMSDGTVIGWGDDSNGQISPPDGLTGVTAISAGYLHSLAATCGPIAPAGLAATAISYTEIDLTWLDESGNETGFAVERALDNAGIPGTWSQVGSVGAGVTTYRDLGVSSGTKYWYRVRSYDGNGGSPYSNQASATTPCATQDMTTIVTQPVSQVVCVSNSATFTVIATGNALTYQWRKNGVNLSDAGSISGAHTPTLTVSNAVSDGIICGTVMGTDSAGDIFGGVVAGRSYTYQASGCVSYASGAYSDPNGMRSTNGCFAFRIPGIIGGYPNYTCPGLTNWSLIGEVDGNCIQLGEDGCFVAPATGGLTLYCNDQLNLFGDNGGSWNVCVDSEANYDVIITGTCGTEISSGAVLSVNSTPGCMALGVTSLSDYGYTIDSNVVVMGSASASAGVAGVTVNSVMATSANGFANWAATASGLIVGTNTLIVIATDQAVPPNSLTNIWHVIYAAGSYDGNGDGLPDAWQMQYFGCVTCPQAAPGADPDGDGFTNLQEFEAGTNPTLPSPTAPSNLAATAVATNQINLSWSDNSTNESGFLIERAPDNGGSPGTWVQIASVGMNITSYSDMGLAVSTRYWYRVRAYNANGDSVYSNVTNATTSGAFDSWISPAGGKWEAAGSWSLGVPPSVFLLGVLITNDNTKTVTIDATTVSNFPSTMTISNLTVAAPSGVTNTLLLSTAGNTNRLHVLRGISLGSGGLLDVENSSLQVDSLPTPGPAVGAAIDGTLLFQNGGLITFSSRELQSGGRLAVGNVATGQMMVAAGTVNAGTLDIGNAAGSLGTLTISGVATVRCSSLVIGPVTNATGTVWMTGGELTATNGGKQNTSYVGNGGMGQMTVSNGMVLSGQLLVGTGLGSHGTLTVAGGSVTISSTLNIGSSTATGAVWVTGGRLVATNGPTLVGASGAGQLTVTAGYLQALSMAVGQFPGAVASLTISGGTATVWSSLVVGNCGTTASGQVTVASGGSLFVTNATHTAFLDVRNGTLVVNNGGVLVADNIIATNGCGRIIRSTGGTIVATTLVLDPSLSAVGGGIPNGWKQQYGFDPFDPTVDNADPDGDGFTNLQEYLAGTDPTNSASVFCITSLAATGNDLLVSWKTGIGRTNALQATAGDGSGSYNTNNFTDIFTVTNTVGSVTNYLDPGAATNFPSRFYRVRLVP